ncbi:hypothetical protein EIKCOROL_01341 [Eikenella corrodens ATCC 23834]|uniref:Uncharacterized protein n=1 Tax=Eikenella corrodens ATCC 23834 TaxID=546274 RepID=C0DVF3_EIKCO|nr:hypothetical protein EIKCOROL_01341 [Eikenella corrodens ATCC 23834]
MVWNIRHGGKSELKMAYFNILRRRERLPENMDSNEVKNLSARFFR